jgi:hypothetical protein
MTQTQDTIQPADAQASQADFVILTLADAVLAAEEAVTAQMRSVEDILSRARKQMATGRGLNSLGELQSAGAAVDCRVGALEAAASAFTTAWNYLGGHFPYQGNPDATQETMRHWLDATTAKSPRLQAITKNPSIR